MEQWETVSLNRTSSSASSVSSASESVPASPAAETDAEESSSSVENAESQGTSSSSSAAEGSLSPDATTPVATSSDLKDDETTTITKHPLYYFDDGNVCFLVEETLYCIHRYFFQRDSRWFRDLFTSPKADTKANIDAELLTGDVFLLDGITCAAFDAFLSILYPIDFDLPATLTAADWAVVLKLASIWDFASIRRLAITQLDDLVNDFDRLLLGRSCGIDAWVLPALTGLCERPRPLSLDEILQMTPQDIALVTQIREDVRCPQPVEVVGSIAVRRLVWERLGGSASKHTTVLAIEAGAHSAQGVDTSNGASSSLDTSGTTFDKTTPLSPSTQHDAHGARDTPTSGTYGLSRNTVPPSPSSQTTQTPAPDTSHGTSSTVKETPPNNSAPIASGSSAPSGSLPNSEQQAASSSTTSAPQDPPTSVI